MKNLILIAFFSFFSFSIFAKSVNVKVNGMVCEFCVSTIQKNLYKNNEVNNVAIDLDNQNVFIEFKKGQNISNEKISDIIVNNGYSVEKISRD